MVYLVTIAINFIRANSNFWPIYCNSCLIVFDITWLFLHFCEHVIMERRHLTREEMLRAVGMLEAGARQVDVAHHLQTTQSVISRLWRRYTDTGDVAERHLGPSRLTTPLQDRYLLLSARRNNTWTARQLAARLMDTHQVAVSDQTVRNRLHEVGLASRRPLRVPPLSRTHRIQRNRWARQHGHWNVEDWSRILFSDESRFGIHPDSRQIRVWRQSGRENRLRSCVEVHSYKGGTIMVWAGICLNGRTDLIFVDGFINAERYRDEIILPVVVPFLNERGENFIFMHDNARPHTAQLVINTLQEHGIQQLPWPAQSPDMNPIEHAWALLKRRMLVRNNDYNNRQQLFRVLQEEWLNIPQETINNLILSMPNRVEALDNNHGGHTDF